MTLLVWLAASSLVWGAVLWGAAIALQSGNDLSGRARQWIWRGAAVLLVMPWLAVPVVGALAPDLSGSLVAAPAAAAAPVALTDDMLMAEPALAIVTAEPVDVEAAAPVSPVIVLPWLEILAAILIVGWLARIVMARLAAGRLREVIAASQPAKGAGLLAVKTWSRRLALRADPALRIVSPPVSPFSTGIRRPVICLPDGMEQGMRPDVLDLVVGHECIHVARGDGWRRPLERAIADVLWFNPFAWAMRRELDLARELACDEAVVEASSARHAYARTLRDVAGMAVGLSRSAPAASMSLSGGGRLLAMRMKRTLDAAARKPAKAAIAGAVMLAFAATPMAIAQAILIEAVQPPDPPPAPPAPPAPAAITEFVQAPLPPAAPPVAMPAQAPKPPAPPSAPSPVDAVAPVAAVSAVSPVSVPSPAPRPAPVAQPSPPTPEVVPTPPTPPVLPTPERIQFIDGALKLEGAPSAVIAVPARFTGGYGFRTDPFTQKTAFHEGVDIAAAMGTAVHTPGPGVVTFAGVRGAYGRTVEVTLDDDHKLRFSHLNGIAVVQGEALKAGDIIGTVGSSGRSDEPHLHLEVLRNGKALDPLRVQGLILTAGPLAAPPTPSATPAPLAQPLSGTPTIAVTPLTPLTPLVPTTPVTPAPEVAPAPPAPSETQAGEGTNRKTDLIDIDGKRVDSLPLRYEIDGTWVIDNQNILYRDTSRYHYLVTLKEACKQLDVRRRSFNFFPSWSLRLLASKTYEVRHDSGLGSGGATGRPCGVDRIAQIDDARANTLRDAAQWRAR